MSEDAFARDERKVPPRTRPAPALETDERATIVCGCGVLMTLAWRRAEPVRCFGCGREFAPPAFATAAPLRWRPELATPPRRETEVPWPVIITVACAAVLFTLLGLALGVLLAHP